MAVAVTTFNVDEFIERHRQAIGFP